MTSSTSCRHSSRRTCRVVTSPRRISRRGNGLRGRVRQHDHPPPVRNTSPNFCTSRLAYDCSISARNRQRQGSLREPGMDTSTSMEFAGRGGKANPPRQRSRQRQIAETVIAEGTVRIEELAEQFGVSVMTVHRDLDELEAQGVLRKS